MKRQHKRFNPQNRSIRTIVAAALLALPFITSAQEHRYRYSVGAQTGYYCISQEKLGATLDKATGPLWGLSANYNANDRLAVNTGFSTAKFDLWDGGRYYRIPLSVSYSLTPRRELMKGVNLNDQSIGSLLLYSLFFGYVPQTFELEAGMSFGFYEDEWTKTINQKQHMGEPNPMLGDTQKLYTITRENRKFVPSIDLGVRWTFHVSRVNLSICPTYSYLLTGDNSIVINDENRQRINSDKSNTAFTISAILSYSFKRVTYAPLDDGLMK